MNAQEIYNKLIKEAARECDYQYEKEELAFISGGNYALKNQWISVDEALPEFQQSVVVTNSEGDYWTSWRLNDNCEDTDDNGFVNNGIGEITHWMPIPSLEGDEK